MEPQSLQAALCTGMLIDPRTNLKNEKKERSPVPARKLTRCPAVRHITEPSRFTTELLVTKNCCDYITSRMEVYRG